MSTAELTSKADELYGYVQERCLWQFYSRTPDRVENIDGVVSQAILLLLGEAPLRDTPVQRLQAADAKSMVSDFHERFTWLKDSSPDEIRELMKDLRDKLTDIAISRSRNRELNHSLY